MLSNVELEKMRNTLISPLPGQQISPTKTKEFKLKRNILGKTLPWWFIFIAYGLSFLVVSISAIFIIARGIEFGDSKTRKWLTSSISGFFSSILLTQPVKVVLMAIFFALIIRKDNDDIIENDDDDDIFLDGDEEYLHAFDDGSLLTFRTKSGHIPLTSGEIAYARQKRLNEIKMWEILRELLAYASFLWILYVVSYSNRDPNAFYVMNHLREDLLNVNSATDDFTKVNQTISR
jgi:polycystin 1L2